MIKMVIYRVDIHSDYPVSVIAQIDLKYPLAGCVHVKKGLWNVIDLETGLSFGRYSSTLKECGPIVAERYDRVQEIKRDPKNWDGWLNFRVNAVRNMIFKDNNTKLYDHLDKYAEVSK